MSTISYINKVMRPIDGTPLHDLELPDDYAPRDQVEITPGQEPGTPDKKKWTVLVYMQGNNNLGPLVAESLSDLAAVGSDDNLNIVSQLSYAKGQSYDPAKISAKRYYVEKNKAVELADLGYVDMGAPKAVSDFLEWGIKKFPAEHYLVIMEDHGDQWLGGWRDEASRHMLTMPQIAGAISEATEKTGVKPDVVAFDSCLMAGVEVAKQLEGKADIMIGSEEVEFGSWWSGEMAAPLRPILGALKAGSQDEAMAPRDLGIKWVEECSKSWTTPTQSAVDLGKIGPVAQGADDLADLLLSHDMPAETVRNAVAASQHYETYSGKKPFVHLHDAYDFADVLTNLMGEADPDLAEKASALRQAVQDAVIAEEHQAGALGKSHGLSIYIPTEPESVERPFEQFQHAVGVHLDMEDRYDDLDMAIQTRWDEMFKRITYEK